MSVMRQENLINLTALLCYLNQINFINEKNFVLSANGDHFQKLNTLNTQKMFSMVKDVLRVFTIGQIISIISHFIYYKIGN